MPDPADSRDFPSVMADLGMLAAESAADLQRESGQRNISPTRLALERGLLSADQAEIAEAMLAPFDTIPGYELLSLLGQGGMGAVFRARQLSLNRIVALKTVLLNRIGGANSLARFEQEAVTLARLVHPHIVSAYDFGKRGTKIFLALEFVQGEDAEQFVRRRGSLEEAFAWQLIRQAASGLAHAAQLNIVHRDVKPANLLLVDPPAGFPLAKGLPLVKIADFGLALLESEEGNATRLTSANTALGSPNYMAPEQISGELVDLRADIYALGATAYQFLAGKPPFAGQKLQAILGQKLSTGPKPLQELRPDLSPASLQLVARMMALKPEDRPQSYDELFAALENWSPTAIAGRGVDFSQPQRWAVEQTQELPAAGHAAAVIETQVAPISADCSPPTSGHSLSRRHVLLGALGALACGSTFFAWKLATRRPPTPAFQYQPQRYFPDYPLFQGKDVTGFSNIHKEWRPTRDHEGGTVLAGTSGWITRVLPAEAFAQSDPQDWQYRVTMIVNRHEARSAHLLFAFAEGPTDGPKQHRVSVGPEFVQVAPADGWAFGESQPIPVDPDRPELVLQIVRHLQGWFVLVNERPAFHLPPVENEIPDRFTLQAQEGTAWFSDITLSPWQEADIQPRESS